MWQPVVDNLFMPKSPLDFLLDGNFQSVPTLRGWLKDESMGFIYDPENDGVTAQEFATIIQRVCSIIYKRESAAIVFQNILDYYLPDNDNNSSRSGSNSSSISSNSSSWPMDSSGSTFNSVGDNLNPISESDPLVLKSRLKELFQIMVMQGPMIQEGLLFDKNNTFFFEFDYQASFIQGTPHGSEIPFVIGLPEGPDQRFYNNTTATDNIVADNLLTLFSNFAKYSNPTPSPFHGITWPLAESESNSSNNTILGSRVQNNDKARRIMSHDGSNSTRGEYNSLFSCSPRGEYQYRYLSINYPLEVVNFGPVLRADVDYWSREEAGRPELSRYHCNRTMELV